MPTSYLEWIDEAGRCLRMEICDRVFVGRVCQGIDEGKRILLPSPLVSRDHAEITLSAGRLRITDTSKNGTWVNGVRIGAGSSQDLSDGDVIRIGDTTFFASSPQALGSGTQAANDFSDTTVVSQSEVVVTSLVSDVRGFTGYSQSHPSSEVYALIKAIFDKFSAVVLEFNGTVKGYAGDAVFSFWEHPAEISAAKALSACRAALRQRDALKTLICDLSADCTGIENLQMGWGITTGCATLSHYGLRNADLALVGDSINLAFRFSAMAGKFLPHPILLCARTGGLVGATMEMVDLGTVGIKGRQGEEQVFALKV